MDGGVVYVPDYGGKLWAVEAGSGRVLWSKSISDYTVWGSEIGFAVMTSGPVMRRSGTRE
jgi:outer membrane protein assembly factor BamB